MNENKDQPPPNKGKSSNSTHYIVGHYNFNMNDVFNAAFSSSQDSWISDWEATCHMTFRWDFFETYSDDINGVIYFADKSQIRPSRIGSIHLKIPNLPNYVLHDVLYIPQFEWNLMSLIHISQ